MRADHPHKHLILIRELNIAGFHPMGFPGYIGVQWCDWLLCQVDDVDSFLVMMFIMASMWWL